MSPQELFWNSWFGISFVGLAALATLIVATLAIAFLRRRLRMTVAWNPPIESGS